MRPRRPGNRTCPKPSCEWRTDYLHRPPACQKGQAGHSDLKLPDNQVHLPKTAPGVAARVRRSAGEHQAEGRTSEGRIPPPPEKGRARSGERGRDSSRQGPHVGAPPRASTQTPPRRSEPDAAGPEGLAATPSATPPRRARPPRAYPLWRPARPNPTGLRAHARSAAPAP